MYFNYVIDFGRDNNVAINLSEDADLTGDLETKELNVVSYVSQTNSSIESLYESEIAAGDEVMRTGGSFKGGVSGAFGATKTIIKIGYKKIFGSEQGSSGKGIILTALISFLAFVLVMYIYKAWVGKNPD